jgi:hypothetical protein
MDLWFYQSGVLWIYCLTSQVCYGSIVLPARCTKGLWSYHRGVPWIYCLTSQVCYGSIVLPARCAMDLLSYQPGVPRIYCLTSQVCLGFSETIRATASLMNESLIKSLQHFQNIFLVPMQQYADYQGPCSRHFISFVNYKWAQ